MVCSRVILGERGLKGMGFAAASKDRSEICCLNWGNDFLKSSDLVKIGINSTNHFASLSPHGLICSQEPDFSL